MNVMADSADARDDEERELNSALGNQSSSLMKQMPGMNPADFPRLRVGVDICSVPRIIEAHKRFGDRFLRRVLTPSEIEYCKSAERHMYVRIAGRFAAKEAVVKVLGTGWVGVGWQEVEIKRRPSGEPRLTLYGRAVARADMLGLRHFEVSMSHEKEFAVAFVVAY